MRRRSAVIVLMLLGAISPGSYANARTEARGEPCPLSAVEQQLVEEVVREVAFDAVWVASNAHDLDRGFALSLVGIDGGDLGALTRIGECEKPKTFVPFCEKDPESGFVRCSQLACEAAGVDTVYVSVSLGKAKLKKREPLRYDATTLSGTVVYDPFPSVTWRTVESGTSTIFVSANIFRRPVVTPTGGAPIDLTHTGSVSAKLNAGEIVSIEIDLAFPLLVASQEQITVEVTFGADGVATGAVRQGGRTLATISGGVELALSWEGDCGQ